VFALLMLLFLVGLRCGSGRPIPKRRVSAFSKQ
jgi:hypothetical protein